MKNFVFQFKSIAVFSVALVVNKFDVSFFLLFGATAVYRIATWIQATVNIKRYRLTFALIYIRRVSLKARFANCYAATLSLLRVAFCNKNSFYDSFNFKYFVGCFHSHWHRRLIICQVCPRVNSLILFSPETIYIIASLSQRSQQSLM